MLVSVFLRSRCLCCVGVVIVCSSYEISFFAALPSPLFALVFEAKLQMTLVHVTGCVCSASGHGCGYFFPFWFGLFCYTLITRDHQFWDSSSHRLSFLFPSFICGFFITSVFVLLAR